MEGIEDTGVKDRDSRLKPHSIAAGLPRRRQVPSSPPAGRQLLS
jgi:hypothetical protein